jgi:branched-chain amino acid transport system substrate-binding protein
MIAQDRIPALFVTTPDDLTKRKPTKWIIRTTFSASQPMHALGDYAARHLTYRKVAAVAMDNGYGYETIGGFQRVFEEQGGQVVQKLWVPLNVLDFAPFLSQVRRDVDAVVAVFAGAQTVQFTRQYAQAGLKARLPLLGAGVLADEFALGAIGDDALGTVTALSWAPTLTTPANQAFMTLAESKLKRQPDSFHAFMYSAGRWICRAAAAVGGQVEDHERFLSALRAASEAVADPRGPIKLDEYGNPTQNVYVRKVEKVDGKLQNVVVHTYPMVSQFWTYRPDQFLKSPAYDRGYPPVRP